MADRDRRAHAAPPDPGRPSAPRDGAPARPARARLARTRLPIALAVAIGLTATTACTSPNRGRWRGTFEGGVAGAMELTVNARGTRAEGRITGTTRSGEAFAADFEGSLNQGFLNARFEGSGQTGVGLPAGFKGELQGTLEQGQGEGTWKVDLIQVRVHYEGAWVATQIAE